MKIKRVEHIAIAVDSLRQPTDLLRSTFGLSVEYEEQIGQTRLAMLRSARPTSSCWRDRDRSPA